MIMRNQMNKKGFMSEIIILSIGVLIGYLVFVPSAANKIKSIFHNLPVPVITSNVPVTITYIAMITPIVLIILFLIFMALISPHRYGEIL